MTAPDEGTLPAADWYPDPAGRAEHRWWDGAVWTTALADGQATRVDLHGLPIAPPPGHVAASDLASRISRRPLANGVRPWVLPVVASAIVIVLAVALAVVIRHGDDRADEDAASRKALSEQVESLGSDVSDLSLHVDDLSSAPIDSFTDFSSFSDVTPPIDACELLQPEDVDVALGLAVHVDRSFGYGFVCLMATDQTVDGTAIIVRADQIYGDVRDLFGDLPGNVELRTLVAGDKAYVATAYGQVVAVATKGDQFVEIQVQTAGDVPTDEQMTSMLVAALARL